MVGEVRGETPVGAGDWDIVCLKSGHEQYYESWCLKLLDRHFNQLSHGANLTVPPQVNKKVLT